MPCKNQERKSGFKILTAGLLACVACCGLPVIAAALGSIVLTSLAIYAEKIAMAFFILAVSISAYWFWRSKKAPSCSANCGCKNQSSGE